MGLSSPVYINLPKGEMRELGNTRFVRNLRVFGLIPVDWDAVIRIEKRDFLLRRMGRPVRRLSGYLIITIIIMCSNVQTFIAHS
jgi:hypothetical protein